MEEYLLVAVLTVWVAWTMNQSGGPIKTETIPVWLSNLIVFAVVMVITIALTIGVAATYEWVL